MTDVRYATVARSSQMQLRYCRALLYSCLSRNRHLEPAYRSRVLRFRMYIKSVSWTITLLLLVCLQYMPAPSDAQPHSASLQDLRQVRPLYNVTSLGQLLEYNGQTMVTVCPCLDTWNHTLGNGSTVQLSGCANPDNDSAVGGDGQATAQLMVGFFACSLHCCCCLPQLKVQAVTPRSSTTEAQ